MALFEGTVAFVMISASMKSMDPALEESARVMGASKLRTTLTVTLPLVMPGVLGATLFVFAEMLGSFAAALVLGIPGRIYVITTAIWDSTLVLSAGLRPRLGDGAGAVRRHVRHADLLSPGDRAAAASPPSPARRSGRGRWTWAGWPGCCSASALLYVLLAVVLPIAALILTSLQRFATVILSQAEFTLANYQTALSLGPVRTALVNSLMLGFGVATVGVRGHGAPGLDHLSLAARRAAARSNIS